VYLNCIKITLNQISGTQIMMRNTVDHLIPKKIIERKNKKIICRLMKTKWEIMMQTE